MKTLLLLSVLASTQCFGAEANGICSAAIGAGAIVKDNYEIQISDTRHVIKMRTTGLTVDGRTPKSVEEIDRIVRQAMAYVKESCMKEYGEHK